MDDVKKKKKTVGRKKLFQKYVKFLTRFAAMALRGLTLMLKNGGKLDN